MKRTNCIYSELKKFQCLLLSNWQLYLLMILLFLGIALGCMEVKHSSETFDNLLQYIIKDFFTRRAQVPFYKSFLYSFLSSFFIILILFFIGLSPVGFPVILLVPFFRGFGLGIVSGYLYQQYQLKGIAYSLLTIYPYSILSVTALVLCSLESWKMSARLITVFHHSKFNSLDFSRESKIYLVRFIFYLGIILISSIFDVVLTKLFSSFFIF